MFHLFALVVSEGVKGGSPPHLVAMIGPRMRYEVTAGAQQGTIAQCVQQHGLADMMLLVLWVRVPRVPLAHVRVSCKWIRSVTGQAAG